MDVAAGIVEEKERRWERTRPGKTATEPREAFGVRGACSRFSWPASSDSGSKLHALQTLRDHARAQYLRGLLADWSIALEKMVASWRLGTEEARTAPGSGARP